MTYGDGSYQGGANPDGTFAPLMSLDVCGHEIGHAICTFTADLVYARESGAMNEGFSDIWGAAIEAYVARAVDPNLAAIMNPFGIGEQIDERDGGIQYPDGGWVALRYMDEPGRAGDPDTYGGANWANPDCEPTLVNDQCGVHTNSGVLNKWYFLLTAGEAGTNDLGDSYATTGVGFEVSEQIAYGTELLLTPNATFAEARAASIAFVRTLPAGMGGGACGNLEVEVTNSWHGVGVGPAFSCGVLAGFTRDKSTVGELVTDNSDCDASKTFIVEAAINSAGTVSVSGTATEGKDFSIANPNYDPAPGTFGTHEFVVNIFDDAVIEGEETIILSLGGGHIHTITLIDNDVAPVIGATNVTLLSNSVNNTGWQTVTLLDGPNSFFKTATGGVVSIETLGTGAAYDGNTAADDIILSTPLIDARGLRDINLSFTWQAGGETDAPTDVEAGPDGIPVPIAVPLDYGNLAYSFDGLRWTDFTEFQTFNGILLTPTLPNQGFNEALPNVVEGTQFYLGFRWRNDALVGGTYSFSFDNPVLTASGTGIATEVAAIEDAFGPNDEIFFLSSDGKTILGKITNTSAHDFGCTTVEIVSTGTGVTPFSEAGDYLDKTFTVTPTINNVSASYEVTWYFTDAEISGYEAASDFDRNSISIFKTEGAIAGAGFEDIELAESTTLTTLPSGVAFTSTFSTGFSSFAVGMPQAVLPVNFVSFNAVARGKTVELDWETSLEENNEGFFVERSTANTAGFTSIGWVAASNRRSNSGNYQFTDSDVIPGQSYVYRLRQQDFDGRFSYSEIRQVSIAAALFSVFPNPVNDELNIQLSEAAEEGTTITLLDITGKVVRQQAAITTTSLNVEALTPGVYLLRLTRADGSKEVKRIIKK